MRTVFVICAILVSSLIALTLLGWFEDSLYLTSIDKGYVPMAPMTAFCFLFILTGTIHGYFRLTLSWLPYLLFLLVAFFLADVTLSYFGVEFIGFEQMLVATPIEFNNIVHGRMSPITLLLFLFLAGYLILHSSDRRSIRQLAGVISVLAMFSALILLVGYLYKTPLLYGQSIIPVALTTSLCFFLLSIMQMIGNGVYYFPLNLFFGNKAHVRLLRVILPTTAFLMLAGGALQVHFRANTVVNQALVVSLITLTSIILLAISTVVSSAVISRQLEKAEEEGQKLTAIIGATTDFVGVFSTDGSPLYLNPALRRLAGITAEADLDICHFSQFYKAETAHSIEKTALPEAFASGQWRGETSLTSKEGAEIPVSQVIIYQKGRDGSKGWFAMVARDIGELKHIQHELEQFAYVASHDLKEPLRMVNSFMALLQKNYAPQLDDKARSYVRFAMDGANRMTTLINDLLDYSRTGRYDSHHQQVDLNELAAEVVGSFDVASAIEKCPVFDIGELPTVRGNRTSLYQLFQNLISNALKYRKPEIIPRVSIRCRERAANWEFAVEDNGIGIAQQHFEKIFLIFQRLHTSSEFSGSGIGLALCKKIVDQHGGKIWVASEPEKGSIFYFSISKQV